MELQINETQTEAPEFIEFNDEDRKALSSVPVLREGWMPLEITDESRRVVPKSGNYEISYTCQPVDTDGAVTRGKAKLRVIPPVSNKGRPGHTAPNTKLGVYFLALATDPSFPRYPRKLKAGTFELSDGSVVGQLEANTLSNAVNDAIVAKSMQLYNERGSMVGKRFYGKVVHQVGEDGRIWPSVERTAANPPSDEPLITSEFLQK
jgi:hypothetical protein